MDFELDSMLTCVQISESLATNFFSAFRSCCALNFLSFQEAKIGVLDRSRSILTMYHL